jgi:hypothetical protein
MVSTRLHCEAVGSGEGKHQGSCVSDDASPRSTHFIPILFHIPDGEPDSFLAAPSNLT